MWDRSAVVQHNASLVQYASVEWDNLLLIGLAYEHAVSFAKARFAATYFLEIF